MCGIVGYVGAVDPAVLDRMTDALAHRGPDGRGVWTNGRVSLGHRRLAILDREGGTQPFVSEDGSVVVVFNGEIYNHPALKRELADLGCRFRTRSDTESILHAWSIWGPKCVEHLDGMFAFVVYDKQRRLLFGARDRFGKKPFYYMLDERTSDGVRFAFASEPRALRQHPELRRRMTVSPNGVRSYLLNDYPVGGESLYENVTRLRSGSAFLYGLPGSDSPGFVSWKYWDFRVASEESLAQDKRYRLPGTSIPELERELETELLERLEAAVERRLLSDVPLGVLLSGGVDSTTVLALMARLRPASGIDTFSIGFRESTFDESSHADRVARAFGTRHHVRLCTPEELTERLPRVFEWSDEPLADPSLVPTSLLCEFARERVTVALTGDGGDELLAGYDPFRAVRSARNYERYVPSVLHDGLVVPLARVLPQSTGNMPMQVKVERFLRGMRIDPRLRPAAWMGACTLARVRRLMPEYADATAAEVYAPVLAAYLGLSADEAGSLAHVLDYFQRFYLTDDILVKADRASMFHGLELRSPFLDTDVAGFVNDLPLDLKLRGGTTKYLLKRALRRNAERLGIPREIVTRPKKGFGLPVARWIRHELRGKFREWLVDDWPASRLPMISPWEVERLYDEHVEGRANHYKELWALTMLAGWARHHVDD
jgi:asparagine synthase (glutamine-hydrolysing)